MLVRAWHHTYGLPAIVSDFVQGVTLRGYLEVRRLTFREAAALVAYLAEYFIYRAFHKVPFMWRFHAIHHSSPALDWIAAGCP